MVVKAEAPNVAYLILAVIVAALFFMMDLVGLLNPVHNTVDYLYDPVLYWQQRIARNINQTTESIGSGFALKQENTRLRKELIALQAEEFQYRELEKEVESLKSQLGVQGSEKLDLIHSRVLIYDLIDYPGTIRVNKGSRDGVDEGSIVLSGDYFVGVVREVNQYSSVVATLFSGELQLPVRVADRDTKGILQGNLNELELSAVLKVDPLEKNDKVVLWDERYPLNIIVGEVANIKSNPSAAYKTAIVEPSLDYTQIPYLFIVDND